MSVHVAVVSDCVYTKAKVSRFMNVSGFITVRVHLDSQGVYTTIRVFSFVQ